MRSLGKISPCSSWRVDHGALIMTVILWLYDISEYVHLTSYHHLVPGSAVTGVQAGYCPPEFETTALYCYKVYPDPLSWEDAVTTCSGQKASLMSITTLDEYYYMFNILHSHNMQTSWLGLNDR